MGGGPNSALAGPSTLSTLVGPCPCSPLLSRTCGDSGQVAPLFQASQSAGNNRRADLRTDRRQGGNSPPQPRGQRFSLCTGTAEGVYFHCLTTGASPAHHLRLQNGRRAEKRMCLESEHGYLEVLAFLTLCPLPTCSPSATFSRFPTAISVHTRASFPRLDPTPPPAFPGTVPVPLPPFQYSAGSVEGPHTDLEEAGPRIRSPGTGADGTQPRGQRAGTRTGAHICAQADHVNAAAQEFHRPTPHAPPPSQPLPATHHLSPAGTLSPPWTLLSFSSC
ncbi:uncharacterized protein [Macaca nemestrina]|uniref:uncharacterized protein isoform X1 n=1 Tax=Macaca fascicularis TaxID=9541 RepID=UPI001E257D72|nr:uncharacterized protein LOC107128490 isoform X1 [Macaca fascicularis]